MAVLENDTDLIEQILRRHPGALNERNALGQTPLHLAADKPVFLELLVHAANPSVLNQTTSAGESALDYAMNMSSRSCSSPRHGYCSRCDCARCVVILLNEDCAVTSCQSYLTILESASKRCRTRYIRHMKDRRQRLKRLALNSLSFRDCNRLHLYNESVLDFLASLTCQLLRQQDVKIPLALSADGGSIYYSWDFPPNLSILDTLYRHGFRDTDPFIFGLEPGQLPKLFERTPPEHLYWLYNHGLDLIRPLECAGNPGLWPRQCLSAAHIALLGSDFDYSFFMRCKKWPLFERGFWSLQREISAREIADNCRCNCSARGCSPLIYMLKGCNVDWGIVSLHAEALYTVLMPQDQVALLRFRTFEALNITHTCCRPRKGCYQGLPTEDASEIEDEEAVMSERLEALLAEFEVELHSRLAPSPIDTSAILDFWKRVWQNRMSEQMSPIEVSEIPEAERRSAQEIGVIWNAVNAAPGGGNAYSKDEEGYWYTELDRIVSG